MGILTLTCGFRQTTDPVAVDRDAIAIAGRPDVKAFVSGLYRNPASPSYLPASIVEDLLKISRTRYGTEGEKLSGVPLSQSSFIRLHDSVRLQR